VRIEIKRLHAAIPTTEHLVLGNGALGLGFDARVEVVAQLGSEILLETRVGGASVTAARGNGDCARRSGPPVGAGRPSALLDPESELPISV
jgi:multiple sugar transport system ATP-binding protein